MNKPTEKTFPLAQVLSITTGRLLCDMDGIYEILNHITGDNLFTHVLPRACRFAAPLILKDHPNLEIANKRLDELKALVEEFGAGTDRKAILEKWVNTLPLTKEWTIKSYADKWLSQDPIEELSTMVPPEKIIVVKK